MTDIVVRRVSFDFPDNLDDVFPGDDIVAECYLAAFSLTMPALEPYLIRTYRAVADQITDPALAADVQAFIQQEAQHYKNHAKVNKVIHAQLGDEVSAKLQAIEDQLDAAYRECNRKKSTKFNVVYAEGFEAMTCAMVVTMFRNRREKPDEAGRFGQFQQLFAWHAAEEFEHRTVAF